MVPSGCTDTVTTAAPLKVGVGVKVIEERKVFADANTLVLVATPVDPTTVPLSHERVTTKLPRYSFWVTSMLVKDVPVKLMLPPCLVVRPLGTVMVDGCATGEIVMLLFPVAVWSLS